MKFLNKISNKWLLIITGFFALEGIASFLYSLIREHYFNFQAILLAVIMLCYFLYFNSKGIEKKNLH